MVNYLAITRRNVLINIDYRRQGYAALCHDHVDQTYFYLLKNMKGIDKQH